MPRLDTVAGIHFYPQLQRAWRRTLRVEDRLRYSELKNGKALEATGTLTWELEGQRAARRTAEVRVKGLEAVVAMERSRFWLARELWVRLRRWLGVRPG